MSAKKLAVVAFIGDGSLPEKVWCIELPDDRAAAKQIKDNARSIYSNSALSVLLQSVTPFTEIALARFLGYAPKSISPGELSDKQAEIWLKEQSAKSAARQPKRNKPGPKPLTEISPFPA